MEARLPGLPRANGLLTGTAQTYTGSADCPRCDVVLYLWRALK